MVNVLLLGKEERLLMEDCIFCKIVKGEANSWKVYENESVYAFLDINPVNEYHTLIIPKRHYENIFDTPEDELIKVMSVDDSPRMARKI
jgi:histidine triad (HIT) family protein